jgi:Rrf2 family protein
MHNSVKGEYALQAILDLASRRAGEPIRIADIAQRQKIPQKFLELILLELKNARIVESVRGAKGGYQLRRPPSEIQLSEIIRLIDGPLAPISCVSKTAYERCDDCPDEATCAIRKPLKAAPNTRARELRVSSGTSNPLSVQATGRLRAWAPYQKPRRW